MTTGAEGSEVSTRSEAETTSEGADPSRQPSREEETRREDPSAGQGSGSEEDIVVPAASARNFQHPLLKGKTPEQIEAIFNQQDEAIRDMDRRLNSVAPAPATPSTEGKPEAAPEPTPDYGDDYFGKRIKTLDQNLTSKLTRTLEQMVDPIKKTIEGQAATGAREKLRGELRHFAKLEPYINNMIRNNGGDPNTVSEDSLRNIYTMAVGMATEKGINLEEADISAGDQPPQPPQPPQPAGGNRNVNIPQHRPSAAPLPANEPGDNNQPRKLTENERKLARAYFPNAENPAEEYRKWQEKNSDDVVSPGFSKENW